MTTLRKVNPYRSVRAHRDGVYHDRSDCPTGRLVHSQDLAAGVGTLARCAECRALDEGRTLQPASSVPLREAGSGRAEGSGAIDGDGGSIGES